MVHTVTEIIMTAAADRPLSGLDLHPRVISALKKAGFSQLRSVLVYSPGDLSRRTGLSQRDSHAVLMAASTALLPSPTTALQILHQRRQEPNWGRLSLGCPVLDGLLRGGLVVPGVNEIAGVSAAGKTQLCLQLCLTVQMPRELGGLEGGAVYICTEDAFPSKRLHQMAESFARQHERLGVTGRRLSDNIFVEHAANISSLSVQLQYKLPSLLSQQPVRMVVVDSLAALFRVEFSASQASQRAQLLRSFGARLQSISEAFSVAVVCVNQVAADMDSSDGTGSKPALGLAWADTVTVRLVAHRPEAVESEEECQKTPALTPRTLQVVLAPHLPPSSVQYCIDSDGVHGIRTDTVATHQ